jgi:DNA-binding MarR family transcriptional regulator
MARTDEIPVPECACFRARSMARAITGLYDETIADSGLKTTQLAILSTIRGHGAVTMQELAAELGVDPSTMTRTLAPMEREGFVAIEPGEDRRVKELALTPKGHRKLAEAARLWSRAQEELAAKIGRERFDRLIDDMGEVVAALRGGAPPAE